MSRGSGTAGLIAAALLCAAMSCHGPDRSTIVARVGNRTLSMEDVVARMGISGKPADGDIRRFVTHWVNEELLYQEAQRRGLDESEEFDRTMQDTRRRLLAQAFIDSQAGDTSGIGDSLLQAYYANHPDEFIVRDDMVKLNAFRFLTREKAAQFASLVTRGMNWDDASAAARRDSSDPAVALPGVSGQFVTQHTVFPPEIWKVAASLAIGEISYPVRTAVGFCVIQPVGRLAAGSRAGAEVAAGEIRARIQIERRRQRYEELLGTLRKRYSVEVLLPAQQNTDTTHTAHE